jgi:hypothetical protein
MVVRGALLAALLFSGLLAPPTHAVPAAATGVAAAVGASAAAPSAAVTTTKPRAVVAGSFVVLPSGKLRVSLTSSSTRVKLTWRTAKNTKRTAAIKVRKGVAVKTLPKGSKKIVAQALATRKLRTGL